MACAYNCENNMEKQVFHKKARTGAIRVWTIEVDGRFVTTTFGQLGGVMQEVIDEGQLKNAGKANEISPEDDALAMAERTIRKKERGGYKAEGAGEASSCIDWSKKLPDNLCFYKPDNTLSAALTKKVEDGTAWLGRKRDGEMMVFVKNDQGKVDIYSRRMLRSHHHEDDSTPWAARFAHLVDELEGRKDIPRNSIFLGDVVSDPIEDSRWDVAKVMKTKTPEAIERQKLAPLFFYCWDIAAWDGVELLPDMLTGDRFELIWGVFGKEWDGESWFLPVEVHGPEEVRKACRLLVPRGESLPGSNVAAASLLAEKRGWEGWVVVDPDGVYGDKGFNFRGKPDRPGQFAGKLKPVHEDDFIAQFDPDDARGGGKAGKWGRGKYRGQVGAVSLWQYDKRGTLHYVCECGGGINDDFRAKYSDPAVYPLCLRVLYTDRTYKSAGEKTNALQFPRVADVREDKGPYECINPRL
jgi:hypothetical protein